MRKPASVGAIAGWNVRAAPSARAFSLIDIMVSLSVIALLIALLLPTLATAQEAARRVSCASGLRQQGLAMQNYAFSHLDMMPSSLFDARSVNDEPDAAETIYLLLDRARRFPDLSRTNTRQHPTIEDDERDLVWDGMGKLYHKEYLDHHACYYCPSHRGDHGIEHYEAHFKTHASRLHRFGSAEIAGNYQLRLGLKKRRLTDLNPTVALVSDAVRTQQDYNHINGNNVYRADLSVSWFADTNGELWSTLAPEFEDDDEKVRSSVRKAWAILDGSNSAEVD